MKERMSLYLNMFYAEADLLAWHDDRLILSYPFSN